MCVSVCAWNASSETNIAHILLKWNGGKRIKKLLLSSEFVGAIICIFFGFFPNFSQTRISYATKGTDKMSMHPCINGYAMANWMKQKLYGFKHECCVCVSCALVSVFTCTKTECQKILSYIACFVGKYQTWRAKKKHHSVFMHFIVKGCVLDEFHVRLSIHDMYVFAHLYVDWVHYSQINETKWEKR